jgi:hypothetical protein
MHHRHPVRQTDELRHLARDQEDGDPVFDKFADELVDLGLGTDIDAPGRLVEKQKKVSGRPGRLPAQVPHRSGRAEFPHPALRAHGFAVRRQTAAHLLDEYHSPAQLSDAVSLRRC